MTCAVRTCDRTRQRDSLFCRECLDLMWLNRLERQPDGTYLPIAEWAARMRERRGVAKVWS